MAKDRLQRYATHDGEVWTVYEAAIPYRVGEGNIIASGLSHEEASKLLERG